MFLYLNGNRLRGTIPPQISKLKKLQHLGLWTNGLEVCVGGVVEKGNGGGGMAHLSQVIYYLGGSSLTCLFFVFFF
jgi:hypothetical protein